MTSNISNASPFLRVSREFPKDLDKLTLQIDKSWVDIANAMNVRSIGLFTINRSSITGDNWFVSTANQRQQTLRQVYTFTSTGAINHNINVNSPSQFIRCWGSYTDRTNNYGIIWGTNGGTIPNQISFYLTASQIIFEVDGGSPGLTSGTIILEWLSQP